jgi:outer membrane assembly lipoprotein YfiO
VKRLIITLIFLSISFKAYPFWIWSPKTQKWKNPKYSALAVPYLQYKAALKLFEEEKYKEAYREFKKLLVNYPDAKEAAEGQYYLGRCLEAMDKPYEAFLAYQKVIDSYPNSQRINEVVEREYNIGEYFLNREHKKVLGVSVYDFVDHPAIEIFKRIVDKVPYSQYAPRAQYKMGMVLMELGRYDEARDAFQKLIDNYGDSEWASPAKYQLALATASAFPGAEYDSTYLQEATERLDEFIEDHPEAKISSQAKEQLNTLRNSEAKKNFDIGQFYEKQNKYRSALIYYKKVVDNFPDSDHYAIALERIEDLEELAEEGITKKELIQREKKAAAQVKKEEKIKRKEEIRSQKQAQKQKAKEAGQQEVVVEQIEVEEVEIEEVSEAGQVVEIEVEEKIEEKEIITEEEPQSQVEPKYQEAREEEPIKKISLSREEKRQEELASIEKINAYKEAKRQELFQRREEAKKKKQEAHERKIQEQQERIDEIIRIKEEKRQEQLARIEEIKAQREAQYQEFLKKKETAERLQQEQIEEARRIAAEEAESQLSQAQKEARKERAKLYEQTIKDQAQNLERMKKDLGLVNLQEGVVVGD